MNLSKKVLDNLKYHLIDSTALLAESTPIFATFETVLAGMSNKVSMNARLFAIGLTYLGGMGIAYSKGRDFYRKIFKINDLTSERVQGINDAIYTGLFNLVVAPAIYLASGERDLRAIAIGTASSIALGLANGAPMGYAVDLFRDLTGLKDCERKSYPKFLKNLRTNLKKAVAVGLTAASIGAAGLVYWHNSERHLNSHAANYSMQQSIDDRVEK